MLRTICVWFLLLLIYRFLFFQWADTSTQIENIINKQKRRTNWGRNFVQEEKNPDKQGRRRLLGSKRETEWERNIRRKSKQKILSGSRVQREQKLAFLIAVSLFALRIIALRYNHCTTHIVSSKAFFVNNSLPQEFCSNFLSWRETLGKTIELYLHFFKPRDYHLSLLWHLGTSGRRSPRALGLLNWLLLLP